MVDKETWPLAHGRHVRLSVDIDDRYALIARRDYGKRRTGMAARAEQQSRNQRRNNTNRQTEPPRAGNPTRRNILDWQPFNQAWAAVVKLNSEPASTTRGVG